MTITKISFAFTLLFFAFTLTSPVQADDSRALGLTYAGQLFSRTPGSGCGADSFPTQFFLQSKNSDNFVRAQATFSSGFKMAGRMYQDNQRRLYAKLKGRNLDLSSGISERYKMFLGPLRNTSTAARLTITLRDNASGAKCKVRYFGNLGRP